MDAAIKLQHASTLKPNQTGELTGTRRRNALLLFAALQLLDFFTTMFVIRHGGFEANPIVQSLVPWTGTLLAVLLCKAGLVFLTWRVSRRGWILYAGNVLYILIVGWNIAMATAAVR